jgi:hypothetical protein
MVSGLGVHRDVPGMTMCWIDPPARRCLQHIVLPGNPRGALSAWLFRLEAGRRRAIGVVAAVPVSSSRPRRWCDAGKPAANQKAGVAGVQALEGLAMIQSANICGFFCDVSAPAWRLRVSAVEIDPLTNEKTNFSILLNGYEVEMLQAAQRSEQWQSKL